MKARTALWVAAALFAAAVFVTCLPGCASATKTARVTEMGAAKVLAPVAIAWGDYNQERLKQVVAQAKPGEAVKDVQAYVHDVQEPVMSALRAARDALQALDLALDAAEQGKKIDLNTLVIDVVKAIQILRQLFNDLHIPIPLPQITQFIWPGAPVEMAGRLMEVL